MGNDYSEEKQKILDRIPLEWGKYISCGNGLLPLIVDLDGKLSKIDPEYSIEQVKEKFGGLRFYASLSFKEWSEEEISNFDELIREAEEKSYKICHFCGKTDETVALKSIKGWYMTLCQDCEKKKKYKNS